MPTSKVFGKTINIHKDDLKKYGYKLSYPFYARKEALIEASKHYPYAELIHKLTFILNVNSNRPTLHKKIDKDLRWFMRWSRP